MRRSGCHVQQLKPFSLGRSDEQLKGSKQRWRLGLGEDVPPGHGDLGQLEDDVSGVPHDPAAHFDELELEASQSPVLQPVRQRRFTALPSSLKPPKDVSRSCSLLHVTLGVQGSNKVI